MKTKNNTGHILGALGIAFENVQAAQQLPDGQGAVRHPSSGALPHVLPDIPALEPPGFPAIRPLRHVPVRQAPLPPPTISSVRSVEALSEPPGDSEEEVSHPSSP